MAVATSIRRDLHSTEYKRPPFNKTMSVGTGADAEHITSMCLVLGAGVS
jgi:hypothetical protein